MDRKLVVLIAFIALLAVGCQKKEEPAKTLTPQAMMQPAGQPTGQPVPLAVAPANAPHSGMQAAAPAGDPHAGMKAPVPDVQLGPNRKGKVLQTMDASSYTYVEVEENGQNIWLAAAKTAVKKGDIVEFPDSQPMINFTSKTLNRTFDKIIFAQALKVVK